MTDKKDVFINPSYNVNWAGDLNLLSEGGIIDASKILVSGFPSPFEMKVSLRPAGVVADIKRRLDLIKAEIQQSDYDSWILTNKGWISLAEPIGFGLVKDDETPYALIDFFHCSEDDLQKKVEEIIDTRRLSDPLVKTMVAAIEKSARYGCYYLMDSLPGTKTINYYVSSGEQPKEPGTPTVRGNGRQKLVDNGKRQWPEAKRRKGHR